MGIYVIYVIYVIMLYMSLCYKPYYAIPIYAINPTYKPYYATMLVLRLIFYILYTYHTYNTYNTYSSTGTGALYFSGTMWVPKSDYCYSSTGSCATSR
jgi:hypothetical protein